MKNTILVTLVVFTLLTPLALQAGGVYQTEESFLSEVFKGQVPAAKTIWLSKEKRLLIQKILQHRPSFIRLHYWQQNATSAWILSEVGKVKPITVGVVIKNDKISTLKVLAFHESRGWEVKHDFFTRQFQHASLNERHQLTKTVDGISGATLSVRALKKIARIALYLNQQTHEKKSP